MRMSRRCMAAIAGAVVLVHVAAVHAQSPSAPTPEAEPSAKKNQPLPKIEVIGAEKEGVSACSCPHQGGPGASSHAR